MNIDLRKLCRICFVDSADIDIMDHKVITGQTNDTDIDEEHTICEIMQTMFVSRNTCYSLVAIIIYTLITLPAPY